MRIRHHLYSIIQTLLITLQLIVFLFISMTTNAQGWEKTYPVAGYENALTEYMTLTQDGGYCLAATVEIPALQDILVMKLDAEGNQQWVNTYGEVFEDRANRIYQLDDGGYIIGGLTFNNTIGFGDYLLLRLDAFGNELWSKTYGTSDSEDFNGLVQTTDGGFLMMGEIPSRDSIGLRKADSDGNELWYKTVGPGVGKTEGRDIKNTTDGGYILTGSTQPLGSSDDKDFYMVKVDANGEMIWEFQIGTPFNEAGEEVIETQDGNYVSVGFQSLDSMDQEGGLYLFKMSPNGDSIWSKTFGLVGTLEIGYALTEAANGDLIIVGTSTNGISNDGFGYMLRTDADGNLLWERLLTETNAQGYPAKILPTPDGGYAIAATGDSIMTLIKTDSLVNSFTTYVQGNIFHDIDDDCLFDNGEEPLEGWMVIADGDEDYFSITDAQGNYSILLDTGEYILQVISSNELWQTCTTYDSFPLILNDLFDTTILNVPIQSVVECPNMTVDISTPSLRRCFENTYYVKYCNDGTLDEANAYVEVLFDPYLTVTSSSLSYTDLGGNLFSFDVGQVGVGACGEFSVDVMVDCDSTVLGQTHCVNAHIFPDSFCLIPSTVWDSSSLVVSGECVGDSVVFQITNVGVNAMSEPEVVKIIEDDVVVFIQIINLNPGQFELIPVEAQGTTFRAEVDQAIGHPGNSTPTAIVEGCGTAVGNQSLGFVTQFPMDDGNHFIDIDCQKNVGSYDPNTKAAYPKGYGNEHYISKEDDLEYHIRFQNTGTDTAFTVVVRDTISDFLDPTTIRLGASSHDYEYELLDNGVVKFTFKNIMLPDSSTNLEASNGFVKFKISQQPDNSPGTLILNSAAIYFDFNAPIITEEIFHFIEIPTVYLIEEIGICRGEIINGLEIQKDTLLKDTVAMDKSNDIFLTLVTLLEHSYSDTNLVINSGTTYEGIPIFSDTIIILNQMAVNGCDSIQTVNLEVIVGNENPSKEAYNFSVHPNPVKEWFNIEYQLPEKSLVNIELFGSTGRQIGRLIENEYQLIGKYIYQIDSSKLNTNVLFVRIQIEDKTMVQKIILIN